ncbi:hypothetical protein NMG60_11030105 [Bertholletia excelsa]
MGSLGIPKPWVPYLNTRDCSQGFCSLYCPQWCYLVLPPPPPVSFPENGNGSGTNLSPLVIAIIGILASAFLLVSYYAIISKYFPNSSSGERREDPSENGEVEDPSSNETWQGSTGLDEAQIKSITAFKYRKGEYQIDGSDCSVCLGEFLEDESLRLLPKCNHAFHLPCIDAWLRSHSTCPLCRADVINAANPSPPPPQLASPSAPVVESSPEPETAGDEIFKSPVRVLSELGSSEHRDTIIEIVEESEEGNTRSMSMDFGVPRADLSKCVHGRARSLHCVMSPVLMKRSSSSSSSSGRFSFHRRGRGRNTVISVMPL